MRTPRVVATELENFLTLLIGSGIALIINRVIQVRVGRATTRITWSSPDAVNGALMRERFATVDEYCAYLNSQLYSAVLYDGALLQMSYDLQGDDLVGHRLCYYPCPFDMDPELLQTEPIGDVVDIYRESSSSSINLRSPCRFDYDPASPEGTDPIVHMHVIRSHCRWPVTAPLSLGHFIKFVFRHFYPEMWTVHPFLRDWPRNGAARRMITADDEELLHISCDRQARPLALGPRRMSLPLAGGSKVCASARANRTSQARLCDLSNLSTVSFCRKTIGVYFSPTFSLRAHVRGARHCRVARTTRSWW
ncbi:MAG: DUF2290 domain-containing protein [Candidatus Acidiferrales bacterium]